MQHQVLLIFICTAGVLSAVDKEKVRIAQSSCLQEVPTQTTIHDQKKYTACLFKKMGFLNENGDFQEEALRKNFENVLSKEKIDEIFRKCTVKKNTTEESAYHAVGCIENINRV